MERDNCGCAVQHLGRDVGPRNALRADWALPEPRTCLFFLLRSKKPNSVCLQRNEIIPDVHLTGTCFP